MGSQGHVDRVVTSEVSDESAMCSGDTVESDERDRAANIVQEEDLRRIGDHFHDHNGYVTHTPENDDGPVEYVPSNIRSSANREGGGAGTRTASRATESGKFGYPSRSTVGGVSNERSGIGKER